MQVIPVVDLKGGLVVRAQRGERHLYAPIKTPLAASSRPADVVRGFRALYPFPTVYVADLDAIQGTGNHAACLVELEAAFPDVNFWVDAGIGTRAAASAWLAKYRGDLVLGSESLRDEKLLSALRDLPRSLLSLDFRGDRLQGPARLAEDETLWPDRVIVMSLARVGSGAGPDLRRLNEFRARAGARHAIFAAGGLHAPRDLQLLAQAGIGGVLTASALHDGRIGAAHLALAAKRAAQRKGEPESSPGLS